MSTTRLTGIRPRIRPRTGSPAAADDYLDLVRQFPLRPIATAGQMRLAQPFLDHYVGRDDLTPGQRDYVAALAHFAADYERRTLATKLRRLKPLDLLKHLLRENGMSTSDLGAVLGSRGLASEVLHGKRGLSKTLIAKLSRRFNVDPSLFLDVERKRKGDKYLLIPFDCPPV
jgi:HTH-type transcriptional regulator / antitoxin HigA